MCPPKCAEPVDPASRVPRRLNAVAISFTSQVVLRLLGLEGACPAFMPAPNLRGGTSRCARLSST